MRILSGITFALGFVAAGCAPLGMVGGMGGHGGMGGMGGTGGGMSGMTPRDSGAGSMNHP